MWERHVGLYNQLWFDSWLFQGECEQVRELFGASFFFPHLHSGQCSLPSLSDRTS